MTYEQVLTHGEKEMKTSSKAKVYARCFHFIGRGRVECMVRFMIDSHIIKNKTKPLVPSRHPKRLAPLVVHVKAMSWSMPMGLLLVLVLLSPPVLRPQRAPLDGIKC